jgi:hypothetical protein
MTPQGVMHVVPVRCDDGSGRNQYAITKEAALRKARRQWMRIYTDRENARYDVFPAPIGRYPEPVWPKLTEARIIRLCFREKGTLIDSEFHPRFQHWAGRKDLND